MEAVHRACSSDWDDLYWLPEENEEEEEDGDSGGESVNDLRDDHAVEEASRPGGFHLEALPFEIWQLIVCCLGPRELGTLYMCSRSLRHLLLSGAESLWRLIHEREFGMKKRKGGTWRNSCIKHHLAVVRNPSVSRAVKAIRFGAVPLFCKLVHAVAAKQEVDVLESIRRANYVRSAIRYDAVDILRVLEGMGVDLHAGLFLGPGELRSPMFVCLHLKAVKAARFYSQRHAHLRPGEVRHFSYGGCATSRALYTAETCRFLLANYPDAFASINRYAAPLMAIHLASSPDRLAITEMLLSSSFASWLKREMQKCAVRFARLPLRDLQQLDALWSFTFGGDALLLAISSSSAERDADSRAPAATDLSVGSCAGGDAGAEGEELLKIQWMIERGAPVESRGVLRALHVGKFSIAMWLLERLDAKERTRDLLGLALMYCAQTPSQRALHCCQRLIEYGADASCNVTLNQMCPRFTGAPVEGYYGNPYREHSLLAMVLLRYATCRNMKQSQAQHMRDIVELLCRNGADPNVREAKGKEKVPALRAGTTPMLLAFQVPFGRFILLDVLCRYGGDPGAEDDDGCNALHYVAKRCSSPCPFHSCLDWWVDVIDPLLTEQSEAAVRRAGRIAGARWRVLLREVKRRRARQSSVDV